MTLAEEDKKLITLSKQIIEAKTSDGLYEPFEELKNLYFKENKFSEFVAFLASLSQKKKNLEPFVSYYIGLSRYTQLKFLEEKQQWEEYFAQGNNYRNQISEELQKVLESVSVKDTLHLYARLTLWQFHKDQHDVFSEQALQDLISAAAEYAKATQDAKPIREVADMVSSYGEKLKSKELYRIYVEKILNSQIADEYLNNIAGDFYKSGNLELAEIIYDEYIQRITKTSSKENLLSFLTDIVKLFYAGSGNPQKDLLYAESIFKRIEELGGKDAFDETLLYAQAFNAEKAKEYDRSKSYYNELIQRFPESIHIDESNYKIGFIALYVLRDIKTGREYFEKLAKKENVNPRVISSLYHAGLLYQWENKLERAKEYYTLLLAKAKEDYRETVQRAKERLKEIEESKPIEYNLKTFLDLSLKEENARFDTTKVNIKASLYRAKENEAINVTAFASVGETGCMQVGLQYLWSGNTGTQKPSFDESGFPTSYVHAGTKEINLVVVAPSGIIDRNIELVDVD